MALDKEYFDSINIDVVKKKYYNANKVNALLEDIRNQAEELSEENALLKAQLREICQHKDQIGDTLLTAQATARDIVDKARVQAAQIVAEARQKREELLSGTVDPQEYAAGCVERVFDKLRLQQLENIEKLNGLWQEFLCGLVTNEPEEEPVSPKCDAVPEEEPQQELSNSEVGSEELESMVNAIARELMEITGDIAEPEEREEN